MTQQRRTYRSHSPYEGSPAARARSVWDEDADRTREEARKRRERQMQEEAPGSRYRTNSRITVENELRQPRRSASYSPEEPSPYYLPDDRGQARSSWRSRGGDGGYSVPRGADLQGVNGGSMPRSMRNANSQRSRRNRQDSYSNGRNRGRSQSYGMPQEEGILQKIGGVASNVIGGITNFIMGNPRMALIAGAIIVLLIIVLVFFVRCGS